MFGTTSHLFYSADCLDDDPAVSSHSSHLKEIVKGVKIKTQTVVFCGETRKHGFQILQGLLCLHAEAAMGSDDTT